ncbi:MAG: HAD family hydrolase [Acidobacteria bacterium]|nr:HAD family hydrolase [Acidobacteriota bacterium]
MIETLRHGAHAGNARVALFDFDGTLSLIRSGWVEVMVPMMVEILLDTRSGESEEDLTEIVKEYVGRLTGRQTIYQMIEFAEQISKRGGTPKDPIDYKHMYLDRLMVKIKDRIDDLDAGRVDPERWLVPGSMALLNGLRDRGIKMYLASGTDDKFVKHEATILGLQPYFEDRMYGALDDYKSFSKAILIKRIIDSAENRGEEFIGFGDGYVEIENVKAVGGVAVGVASDEPDCAKVDEWKRNRLVNSGADWIVPHFNTTPALLTTIFP